LSLASYSEKTLPYRYLITLKGIQMVIIAYMVVRIDISILANHFRCTLMKEIWLSNRYRKSPNISDSKLSGTDKSHNNASDITDVIPIDDEIILI
jgi:hypothetical protein